jgi:hypothetical protein
MAAGNSVWIGVIIGFVTALAGADAIGLLFVRLGTFMRRRARR